MSDVAVVNARRRALDGAASAGSRAALLIGAHARLSRPVSARCRSRSSSSKRSRRARQPIFAALADPDAALGDRAHPARRRDRRADQHGRSGSAAAWAIAKFELSRQERSDHADRSAVLRLAGRVAASSSCWCSARRACSAPGSPAHDIADHFRRSRHRAGDDLRHLSVRRARADPADAGAGNADEEAALTLGASGLRPLPHRHAAQHQMGAALRRPALQRASDGRIRRGVGRLRPHPRPDQHDPAAGGDPLQ